MFAQEQSTVFCFCLSHVSSKSAFARNNEYRLEQVAHFHSIYDGIQSQISAFYLWLCRSGVKFNR